MKIGILTFHRSHNYGALLQAIALRHVLIELGHEVSYVDYYPEYEIRLYELYDKTTLHQKKSFKKKLFFILRTILKGDLLWRWLRIKKFERFRNKYTEPFFQPIDTKYDTIIYGSDQLWRKHPLINEYDPVYFGKNNFKTNRHISYAVSLSHLPETENDKRIFNYLVGFQDQISVREMQTKEYLEDNGFSKVSICVDPTLLIDAKEWDNIIPSHRLKEKKYILIFDLQGDKSVNIFRQEYLESFAKRNNCKLVFLSDEARRCPTKYNRQTASPDEFLNLIRYAELVITSSFHATMFAILYHKQFYNAQTWGAIRSKSILSQLGLIDRMLSPEDTISNNDVLIDYSLMDEKLKSLKKSSVEYLMNL